MDLGLEGKSAIVTGSSRGIGRAIAEELLGEGARVVINGRRARDVEKTSAELERAYPGQVFGVPADLSRDEEAANLAAAAAEKFGGVDVLVNNAGVFEAKPFDRISPGEYLAMYNVNVVGAVRMTLSVLPHMLENRWGRIVMIASENGTQPDPMMMHYNLTKASLINLASGLAKAYGVSGVLVNAVSPAFIRTPGVEEMMRAGAEQSGRGLEEQIEWFRAENRPNIKIGRMGTMEEVAALVAFLCSDRAAFINGANYRVDGGSVGSVN